MMGQAVGAVCRTVVVVPVAVAILVAAGCQQPPSPAKAPATSVAVGPGAASDAAKNGASAVPGGVAEPKAASTAPVCAAGSECPPTAAPPPVTVPAPEPAGKVKVIVFLDKEECCDCTRKRQDDAWKVLQDALDSLPVKPPVERVHVDTQADQAAMYTGLEPLMVPPGIYFLDHSQNLIQMLQGEVTRDQIEKILD